MDEGVIYRETTQYDQYTVVEEYYNRRPARVLYSKDRTSAQSGIALDTRSELLFDYNERFMELYRGLSPESLLVVGGGAFTFPAAVLAENETAHLEIVEIDASLLSIATKYFGFKLGKNTHIVIEDGQKYLSHSGTLYGFIVVDAFIGSALPTAFQSPDLAEKLATRLKADGVVAMNLIAAWRGERSQILHRQIQTLQTAFSNVTVFPAGYGMSEWLPQNLIITASQKPQNLSRHLRYGPIM